MDAQKRPPKKGRANPISSAVSSWLETLPATLLELLGPACDIRAQLVLKAPKRWVVYEPMVLLPSGSFTSDPWPALLQFVPAESTALLWAAILRGISPSPKNPLTHLAINEGIPLRIDQDPGPDPDQNQQENLLRSPSGLHPLHGDFGPTSPSTTPSQADFLSAFWVSTKQNGVTQTWAPRWTMFSRGNVKEKARLLSFHSAAEGRSIGDCLRGKWAVDLYGGIGYFVFSYARLGLRVLCWELNAWSVEGLRRGAEANRWSVRVVQGEELALPVADVVKGGEQIVVFLEGNAQAQRRIGELRAGEMVMDVVHVNCGFLPTSEPTWRPAWEIQTGGFQPGAASGWLHLHENVAVADIEQRRKDIQLMLDKWGAAGGEKGSVEHVELVKTFAPDVWHCVIDVYITKPV